MSKPSTLISWVESRVETFNFEGEWAEIEAIRGSGAKIKEQTHL